ncbi:hypothetical protein [Anaerobutyricum soehngenii]|uniref:hypothetical protein n=1 Tax=Anaerobutyricum soehngenii TaxID=105843 RepID=UPI001C129170|nr:hypothetical protein [Anaerobutyricum soehngenii]MBU5416212.1 hypothetical protein [Anaerobutyricum soehngenii]
MREIGGFLELETNHGHEFHENCIALNSGRNCLRYLIREREIKRIWLPKLLCSAISDTCKEENVEILYYSIDWQLRPVLPQLLKNEWLYLINYYGQYSVEEIEFFSRKHKNIIIDNAQAFYTKAVEGLDTIYTCRKFFGVPDGSYLYTTCEQEKELSQDESHERIGFLVGRFEQSAHDFYDAYRENEEKIDALPLRSMSKVTHNLLRSIDYEYEAKIREDNFKYLHYCLKNTNLLNVRLPEGPYMYPFLVENGAVLRNKLQKKQIYIPLLWPNVKQDLNPTDIEYRLSDNILPLPCDQRYVTNDMDYIVKQIIELENL